VNSLNFGATITGILMQVNNRCCIVAPASPGVFRIADIQHRIDNLPENGTFIKPFVTVEISTSMCGGINALKKFR